MACSRYRHPSANALDIVGTSEGKGMGFASIIAVNNGVVASSHWHHNWSKGKKAAKVATASKVADPKSYTLLKLPISREAHT